MDYDRFLSFELTCPLIETTMTATITVPAYMPELSTLASRGCKLSPPTSHFAIGNVDSNGRFVQCGKDAGEYRECVLPARWRFESATRTEGVIVDDEGCVVAAVCLPNGAFDAVIDLTHAGKWYGSAKLYRVREMIAESKLLTADAGAVDLAIEIANSLRGETGMVADELRALAGVL